MLVNGGQFQTETLLDVREMTDEAQADVVGVYVRRQRRPEVVSDLYRHFARHPKARRNPNWRAKVRQTLQRGPLENERGVWSALEHAG